MVSGSVKT